MKKLINIIILAIITLAVGGYALSAPLFTPMRDVYPETNNTYNLGTTTKQWLNANVKNLCLNGDCKSAWPAGGGSTSTITSTDQLPEGSVNLYYTDGRVATFIGTLPKSYFWSTSSADSWYGLQNKNPFNQQLDTTNTPSFAGLVVPSITLNGDTRSAWPSGGGGGVSTSSVLALFFANSPLTYTTTTNSGTFGISQSGASTDGYLSSGDWNIFNNKQPAGSYITLTSLTGDSPITYSTTTGHIGFTNPGFISTSSQVIHNNTSGLQGGSGSNYYHSDQPINTTSSVSFTGVSTTNATTTNLILNGITSTPLRVDSNGKVATGTPLLVDFDVQTAKLGHLTSPAVIDGGQKRWYVLYGSTAATTTAGTSTDYEFYVPKDYVSTTINLYIDYKMSATSTGSITFNASFMGLGNNIAVETDNFDTTSTASTSLPGTVGNSGILTIPLPYKNTFMAGTKVVMRLWRSDAVNDLVNVYGITIDK